METCHISLAERSYDILISTGLLEETGPRVKEILSPSRVLIVSDSNVAPLYAETVRESCKNVAVETELVTFPAGEAAKSQEQLGRLYDAFVDRHLDRKGCVLALGGGVTGDLAGFAAASYMRGVPFVQLPTSLLAQVDSSSGGKTGINHPLGKNLIGAFHQPSQVLIDIATLNTLPPEELLCGLAEVVKHGVIQDRAYFDLVKDNTDRILALDEGILTSVVLGSCRIKGNVVSTDEREGGVRALLNFGHTFGHAYETLSHYRLPHGEAVAMGMVAACHMSEIIGMSTPDMREELTGLLGKLGLPTAGPAHAPEAVLEAMFSDKKTLGGTLRLVLASQIGKAEVVPVKETAPVLAAIERCRAAGRLS